MTFSQFACKQITIRRVNDTLTKLFITLIKGQSLLITANPRNFIPILKNNSFALRNFFVDVFLSNALLTIESHSINFPLCKILTFVLFAGYAFLVTWITAFVMVVVHERVPDMKRYPPLPDIFLDNVPHIPWAFHMCEITGTLLFLIWASVLIVHKHRFVLLRRFFALSGTVFLLRCVTMLITSLSVPGTHLQCSHDDYVVDDTK